MEIEKTPRLALPAQKQVHDRVLNPDMYTTHDERNSDPAYGLLIAETPTDLRALDYIIIRQRDGRTWLVQIVAPNLYLPMMGGDALNPTLLHGLQLSQEHKNVRTASSRYVYKVLYLGEVVEGTISDTGSRPLPGSEVIKPNLTELCGYLGVPVFNNDPARPNVIGTLVNLEEYPLCLNGNIFRMHIGVFGSTGCGKSNSGSNVIVQATYNRMCVLLHDVKPDYSLFRLPNTDPRAAHIWPVLAKFHLAPTGLADVHAIGFLGMCDHQSVDTIIGLSASDFTSEELAGLLFHGRREALQYEAFADAFQAVRQDKGDNATFALEEVLQVVKSMPDQQINSATRKAIIQKAPRRRPPWLDAVGQTINAGAGRWKRVEAFNLKTLAQGGRVIRIAYAAGVSDKDYAIIVSYFLRTTQTMCANERLPQGCSGITQFIDEAHRLFDNESLYQGLLVNRFERVMREGRSKDHGICLLIQNVDRIPIGVMNLINTRIVMKQNNQKMAALATDNFPGDDYAKQAMRLGTGQALVKFAESKPQMAPSLFELLRSDNRPANQNFGDF